MSLTGYMCYHCTIDQAKFIAECAGIKLIGRPYELDRNNYPEWMTEEMIKSYSVHDTGFSHRGYWFWEDKKYGGGACRIVWFRGVAWVSAHSGYSHADITRQVCDLFEEIGCKEVEECNVAWNNPMIYGVDQFLDRNLAFLRESE